MASDSHLTNKQRGRIRKLSLEFSKFYFPFVLEHELTRGEELFILNDYMQDIFREIEKKSIKEKNEKKDTKPQTP